MSIPQYDEALTVVSDTIDYLSCKFITDENLVCAMISSSKLRVSCYKYNINLSRIIKYTTDDTFYYDSVSSFGLYDTDINNIKILCRGTSNNIECNFFEIIIKDDKSNISLIGDNSIVFTTSNDFSENNCYYSKFNNENLFCCGITDYLKCYRVDINYNIIKEFKILISGINTHLTIKNVDNYIVLFFMNNQTNINSVYEYYIYIPECQNKKYEILNSLNENKPEEEKEKLSNLFIIKTNKYFFELETQFNEIGYFTLNDKKIDQKILIENNNYILDFIVTNNNIASESPTKIFNYKVSVEDEEAFSKECQITLKFKSCYHSCAKCSLDINYSNEEQHNCINCKYNYYPSSADNNNCYSIIEKRINWYFDSAQNKFGFCHEECLTCLGPTNFDCSSCKSGFYLDNNKCIIEAINSRITLNEFKNQIMNDITSYVNSTNVINGSNFLAVVLTSDNIEPEVQIKNGISAIDMGNCTNDIKEYYNISKEENLIILNMETKNDEIQNNDKSFNLGNILK